jgi:hypothetical protein
VVHVSTRRRIRDGAVPMCAAPTAFDAQIRPDRLSFIYFIFPFVQFFLFLFICTNSHIGFPIPNHLVVTLVAGFWQIDESRLAVRDSQPQGEGVMPFIPFGDGGSFLLFSRNATPPFGFFLSARRGVCQTVSSLARLFWRRASAREPCVGPNGWSHSDYSKPDATSASSRVVSERTVRRDARSRAKRARTIFINSHARFYFYSHTVARLGVFASRSATR